MAKIFFTLICFNLALLGCKSSSELYSESGDIVLYTRGFNLSIDADLDNDSMYHILRMLEANVEYFPKLTGRPPVNDQTKEEIYKDIDSIVKKLYPSSTLYWFLFGHGEKDVFFTKDGKDSISYSELFGYMYKRLYELKKKIHRLVLINTSCYSGSLIEHIKKFESSAFNELIVFTPVSAEQTASVEEFFPVLVNACAFLKAMHKYPDLSLKEVQTKVPEELDPYPNQIEKLLSVEENAICKIKFKDEISNEVNSNTPSTPSTDSCSSDTESKKPELILSSRKNPTWADLKALSTWLMISSVFENPQLYTYPDDIKNEYLFK